MLFRSTKHRKVPFHTGTEAILTGIQRFCLNEPKRSKEHNADNEQISSNLPWIKAKFNPAFPQLVKEIAIQTKTDMHEVYTMHKNIEGFL